MTDQLAVAPIHPRDHYVLFDEAHHRYTIQHPLWLQKKADGSGTISVTTLIHQLFPKFDELGMASRIVNNINRKLMETDLYQTPDFTETERRYFGMTVNQITDAWEVNRVQASSLGTAFHKTVEDYLNSAGQQFPPTITTEFDYFLNFWRDLTTQYPGLSLYRTEWMVFDENIGLAGSIDCILRDTQGNFLIVDWKRSKEIKLNNRYQKGLSVFCNFDDCNWSHYQLQLNFYREILERHYMTELCAVAGSNPVPYQGKVTYMMNVVCHPDQRNYQCFPVPHIDVSAVWTQLPDLAREHQKH